ncbi:helix-turn-helix domain-containing protein [Alicyclobacillus dauci]|uniref:Helix-turn-helix transcriptional regulator n=1 Tax=Alicyclobacillus dauci TaxID=1475485 RepID=A0ABY6Z5F0_9BACL|nr:helix-turn-helix transcriptional regulator [Alicyclobacillus dauci]WAH37873.1 helix-turn-helix transcriptional regulator [Alicyclobacillus dauci]
MTDPWHDLRDRRCRKGMTQMELAYRIVSQAQMSLIEQGVVMPSEKVISRLAVRVGCHPDIWLEAWAPHRTQVDLKRQLAFVRVE